MHPSRRLLIASLLAGSFGVSRAFSDPLDQPAFVVRHPSKSALLDLAVAGERLVAAGLRGLLIVSDDGGNTWRQVSLGLSSDLVSVCFLDARKGWVTGHDGVILGTKDGGDTWNKLLDGRVMQKLFESHFDEAAKAGSASALALHKDIKLNFAAGPEQPVLGVWFDDAQTGWAVSTFGMAMGTNDGGKTWTSWMERFDNPEQLHLYSIEGIDGDVYVTAEKGRIFRLDRKSQRFIAHPVGYAGGIFGVVGWSDGLLAFGLQGRTFLSRDGGKVWTPLETGLRVGLNAGLRLADGRIVLATQDGRLLATSNLGQSFKEMRVPKPGMLTGLVERKGELFVTGFNGVQRVKT